jgi:hypothetical protein
MLRGEALKAELVVEEVGSVQSGKEMVGYTQIPNSSLFSMAFNFALSPVKRTSKRRVKSPALKCLEHIFEEADGSKFNRLLRTKSTHFFLRFLASGRSSFAKGITCSDIPSSELVTFEHP